MPDYGIFNTAPKALADGEQARPGLTNKGALRTSAEDAAGNPKPAGTTADPVATTQRPSTVSTAASGTIATSGGTAPIAMTNATRTEVLNPSTATLWASFSTPGVNASGSFPINPGGSYVAERVAGTLTLLSTAANQPFTVNRFSYA
jgi:hypothetical protein